MAKPVDRSFESIEEIEEKEGKFIARVAKEASIHAIMDTFRDGRSVMTLQGESIVRKYPDGRTETVRKIEKVTISEKIEFHL